MSEKAPPCGDTPVERGGDRPLIWCGDCHAYYEVEHGTLTAKCPTGKHPGDKIPRSPALVAVTMLKSISDQIDQLNAAVVRLGQHR